MIVKELAEHHHGMADVAYKQTRCVRFMLVVGNISNRAACKRVGQVLFYKMCTLAQKQRRSMQRARVVTQTVDRDLCQRGRDFVRRQHAGARQRIGIFS